MSQSTLYIAQTVCHYYYILDKKLESRKELHISEEIWLKILSYLEPSDLYNAALVCHQWSHLISQSETLWKTKCISVTSPQTRQKLLTEKFKQQKRWKKVYQDNFGHKLTKKLWMDGYFSNISRQKLPEKVMCPMDAETWGQIFELELAR